MRNIGFVESLTIEFKSDLDKLPDNEIIDSVVAFANTDGGELYIGVEDNGDITGLHASHKDPTQLAAFVANRTVPPVTVRCEIIEIDIQVLKISVPRRTSVVATSSGKMLRRRIKADGTPENIPMYPFEIATRLSSLSLLDFSSQPVPDASIADLDVVERERLRNIIRTYHGEQNLLELTDEELDKALQLVTIVEGKMVPTFAGLLLLGKKDRLKTLMPTTESAIQVLQGTDVKVNESFTLPLLAAFEKISEYMNAWNRNEDMEIGLYRISIPDIDYRAFRESLVNAYCHRDYSMLGRVRIQLNDEGLTISNPGGFIEGINMHNLLDAEPHGRNPVLADALKRIGLAERTGRGIDRIFEGSLLYGRLLPDYSSTTDRRVSLFIPKSLPDKAFVKMLANEQRRIGRSLPIHALLVLNSLKHFHRATVRDITDDINSDETKVKNIIESLTEAGLVEATGNGKGRSYILSSKVYRNADNTVGYVRQTGIDKLRYSELVIKLAKTQGYVTRKNVSDLLHISPPQAYRILEKLAANKKLQLVGKGRYAKYVPI
ncbi:RNA-binding domain-containing protein [Desulfitobacterium hafniense]|uniref:RNA-binding domain-containing protein n=1 Tax=Desulfitobacterium hafniense TaxID=49338 RepID=UPI0003675778|nr:RNA-binding domain-containing protein [Desulfitobacterium hafniense]